MIKGVQDIYYNVSDMKRSIAFYTEALQMKLKFEDDGWTSLDCGGVQIGLHPTEPGEEIVRVPRDSHGVHGQATLTLRSDNVSEDRKRIERSGGRILGEDDAPWGHMLVFEDPDGNVLKLMNPKY
jgi:catechol 2,3-dioxygenase-like lactoylglutathione lyase family enzyme